MAAASSRPSVSRTRSPAAVTSAWESGPPPIPAATFDTTATAHAGTPMWRAAITSGTVDMPTRSAPRARSIRISAGVS